nr:MAG TPA_asm: hypothetical protein [Caudoviricetes sp.]
MCSTPFFRSVVSGPSLLPFSRCIMIIKFSILYKRK